MQRMQTAIHVERVSKSYQLYARPIDRFLELFLPAARHTTVPALSEVTFDVPRGESIGVIGQNGAGKSTLLKLLCGVTQPTTGKLQVSGTIASILELGTGFHPEFSGRDNAALNAAILGLSPSEIRERLPAILEFSELGKFLDRPIKTYSSGMYMRLAFSVAVNVDPDILIIDEALAVGDGHFQKKCVDKIREFQQRNKTIFFCSHALYYISTLCTRTIWLDRGAVQRIGPSVDVVHEYETFLMARDREAGGTSVETMEKVPPIRIAALDVCDSNGRPKDLFATGDDIDLHLTIESDNPRQPIHVLAGVLRAADEMQCFAVGTQADGMPPISGQSIYHLVVRLEKVPLLRGDYAIVVFVGDENAVHVFDRKDLRPAFSISGDKYEIGMISVNHSWEIANEAALTPALGSR